jgi:hypothetical protein
MPTQIKPATLGPAIGSGPVRNGLRTELNDNAAQVDKIRNPVTIE